MSDFDEIDALVAEAVADVDDDDDVDLDATVEEPVEGSNGRVVRRKKRSRVAKVAVDVVPKLMTLDELDVADVLPVELPEPEENVKTLGSLYAKYNVGDNMDFRVQVHRNYPKVWGGKSIEGLIDTWDEPILEDKIQAEYGGGTYRCVVVGPNEQKPGLPKHYGSIVIKLSGDPNVSRQPRNLQVPEKPEVATPGPGGIVMMPPQENPNLVTAAFKMMDKSAERERDERRRAEDKLDEERREQRQRDLELREVAAKAAMERNGYNAYEPVIEAERRRADEVVKAQQERFDAERQMYERAAAEAKATAEETRRRMESFDAHRPSMADELSKLANSGLFNKQDDGGTRILLEKILEKHQAEVAEVQRAQNDFIRTVREGHEAEKAAIRSAHERELVAEREAARSRESRIEESARSREERIEERLANEREERRRDQDRFKIAMDDRDRQWNDRMLQSKELTESTWQARHGAEMSAKDMRVEWLQGELDRLRSELAVEKAKQEDKGDIFTQIEKFRQFKDVMGDFQEKPVVPTTGGIGMGSGSGGWQETLAEGAAERLPDILSALMGGLTGANQQAVPAAPPQYQPGQEVMTAQGPMVAVQDPQGRIQFARREDVVAYQQQMAAYQNAQLAAANATAGAKVQQERRSMPDTATPRRAKTKTKYSVTPNFAEDFPKRVPPWEGGTAETPPQQAQPHQPPLAPPAPPPRPMMAEAMERDEGHVELSATERQGLKMVAKEIEDSVMVAEDPDEFVERLMSRYPTVVLQQVVGTYSDRQIAAAIRQVFPGSGGATPAGQQFIKQAFAQLRSAVSEA